MSGTATRPSNGRDPTENVKALTEAAVKRIDDMSVLRAELADVQVKNLQTVVELHAQYQKELSSKEAERLDSIRQVDREDVNKTAAQALNAIQTLATTTNTTAETLRNQVATTAQQAAQQRAIDTTEFNKRLSAVELALSEGKGKQTIADPQLERLASVVEALARNQATGAGKSEGIGASWGVVVAVIGVIATLLGIGGVIVTLVVFLNRDPSPAAYVPAPQGTQVPAPVR